MDITPLGLSSFRIRGKTATLVTDPYDSSMVGIKFPKVEADIVVVSHNHADHNNTAAVGGSPFLITGPGEYEIKGVSIIGLPTFHDNQQGQERGRNTIYRVEIDGATFVHLGDLGHVLSSEQVESLNGVDVLFIPVGGTATIDPLAAKQVISELEPTIVIPMHYGTKELNQKVFGDLLPVSAFLSEMSVDVSPVAKLTVSRDKLPSETQIVILE